MDSTPTLYALLIGIDKYDPRSRVPHLRGCVTDTEQMERLLRERFNVPSANIVRLFNEKATHQGIKDAFRDHFIGNARRNAQTGSHANENRSSAAFLFHYSGHGSQAIDETGMEPDGLDETIVPYDSRTPGVFDIKDWELGALIEELNQFSDNVTVILDCCHSGSGTRDAQLVLTRRCAPDLRPQPLASQRPASRATARAVGAGNWEIGGQHVLLAGCRDQEESHEYAVVAGGQRYWQGAMSYFLQQELHQLSATRSITYRELFARVRHTVNKTYSNQMPQCEGDIDRELFGGLRPERDAFYMVVDHRDGLVWIDGGVAHGLTLGSELLAFSPEIRTLATAESPLATLRIVEEGAVASGCEVEDEAATVPLHARCAVHRVRGGSLQHRVQVAIDDDPLQSAVTQRLQAGQTAGVLDVSPWLKVVGAHEPADFRVVLHHGVLEVQDSSGKLLVATFAPDDLDGLANDLAHLARYHNALKLRNTGASELSNGITIALKRLTFEGAKKLVAAPFPETAGGEPIVEERERVVIEVTNQSEHPLYFAIFDFSPDWAVTQLYPNVKGAHEVLKPGATFALGLSNRRRSQLSATLPEGYAEAIERFKVIATVEETNFELLQQGPLKSPFVTRAVTGVNNGALERPPSALDELLGLAINGNQRAFGAPPATVADEWTTAELSVLVTSPADQMTRTLTPGSRTVLPAYGVAITPPPAFNGTVRILTDQQVSRALSTGETASAVAAQSTIPPGLAAHLDIFEPLALGNRRAATPMGVVLELEADDEARQAVSATAPLTVQFDWPVDEAQPVFAVAYEDGLFYPVGHSAADPQTVAISWLPTAESHDNEAKTVQTEAEVMERRGLGRVLKLYFYKVAGWQEDTLGLHRVQFIEQSEVDWLELAPGEFLREIDGGALLYSPIDADAILPRQRIAVAVHGFSADSKTLGQWLTTVLPKHYPAYDHVLAYDYESLATGVSENGRELADALRALELHLRPRLRVDIFAHSMGTLITRCMVETWGGDAFVNRCFLAGPPNQGTRLADAKILVPWLTSLALNGIGGWTPAIIAEWAMSKFTDDAVGVDDLRPSATILADLNRSTKEIFVNYYILAGNNPLLPQADATLIQRLKRKLLQGLDVALDTIFDDQNDLVINVRSMRGLRNGNYPAHLIQECEVPCNHFSYFSDRDSQRELLTWLG